MADASARTPECENENAEQGCDEGQTYKRTVLERDPELMEWRREMDEPEDDGGY